MTKFASGTSPSPVRTFSVSSVGQEPVLFGQSDADLDLLVGTVHPHRVQKDAAVMLTMPPTVATSAP